MLAPLDIVSTGILVRQARSDWNCIKHGGPAVTDEGLVELWSTKVRFGVRSIMLIQEYLPDFTNEGCI